ncbi:MAG TPA: YrhB domain-containing protein [Tepidisphaeraceae bacterium]|jgi:hypothetical protein
MIDLTTAMGRALEYVRGLGSAPHLLHAAIDDKQINETSFAWVFFWNDRRYLETGDGRYSIEGNQFLVVFKDDGKVMRLPTLTRAEYARLKSKGPHGTLEHRIAMLAERLGLPK